MRTPLLAALGCALAAAAAAPAPAAALTFDEVFPDGTPATPTFDDSFPRQVEASLATAAPINLLDYAAGDGTTPDAANVNRAIDAAVAAGRPLYAPGPRTFLVDRPILLRSGLTIFSNGAVFKASGALGNNPVMRNPDFEAGNRDIALIGFQVDANRAARGLPGGGAHGIWMRGGDAAPVRNVLLRDLRVHDAPMLGVPLQNAQDVLVERLESDHHGRDGLTFYWNSRRVRIIAPRIHDVGDDMIGLNAEDERGTGHLMRDYHIVSPTLERQHSQGSGIAVHGARRVLVENARIDRAFSSAISVGNWNSTPAEDLVVDGLDATAAGERNSGGAGHGIAFYPGAPNRSLAGVAGVNRVTMRRVQVRGARAQGITLYAAGASRIRNVSIQGEVHCSQLFSWGHGVHSGTGFIHGLSLNLTVRDCQRSGISLTGPAGSMTGVNIRPRVYDSGQEAPSSGVRVGGVSGLRITGGQATNTHGRTQTYGLELFDISGTGAVAYNDLRGNLIAGLATRNLGRGVLIGGNLGASQPLGARSTAPPFRAQSWLRRRIGLRTLRRRGLRLGVRCSTACGVRSELLISRRDARRLRLGSRRSWRLIGRGHGRLGRAGQGTVVVKLTRTARRRLRRVRRIRMRLRTSVRDGRGQSRTLPVRLRLRR